MPSEEPALSKRSAPNGISRITGPTREPNCTDPAIFLNVERKASDRKRGPTA